MKSRTVVAAAAALCLTGFAAAIRFAPLDPVRWHTDPALAKASGSANQYLLRPFAGLAAEDAKTGDAPAGVYDLTSGALCQKLTTAALAEPRTVLLAGECATGFVTLVQRSRFMGFPDVITIRTMANGATASTLAMLSRSRFGSYDHGVNRARVLRWLTVAEPFLSLPQPDLQSGSHPCP